jgi:hypothetical protein
MSSSVVWVLIHQLESGGYGCIGDSSYTRGIMSHEPETFDATILGIFWSREEANRKALEFWIANEIGGDDDDDDEDDQVFDFVGEGRFIDGAESSGNTLTYSERVFVKRHEIQ